MMRHANRRVVLGVIELEQVKNVRDLGGVPVEGGRVVAPGLFFRGGALAQATEADCDALFGRLGIGCVIDVRTGWERVAKPDVQVPGVENLFIPFYDRDIVGIEYRHPVEGTITIGNDFACDPDHFYRSMPNKLTVEQMRKAVNAVFDHAMKGCPVYQHCSGGKDRAGILALLVLEVLGADRDAILEDYLATNAARDADIQPVYERFLRLADGNEALARELTFSHRARPENLDAFYESIDERYGSMDSFIRDQLGIGDDRREEIRRACTIQQPLTLV